MVVPAFLDSRNSRNDLNESVFYLKNDTAMNIIKMVIGDAINFILKFCVLVKPFLLIKLYV